MRSIGINTVLFFSGLITLTVYRYPEPPAAAELARGVVILTVVFVLLLDELCIHKKYFDKRLSTAQNQRKTIKGYPKTKSYLSYPYAHEYTDARTQE